MKILFLTPQLPYPPKSGGVVKSFELVKFLSQEFQLSIATLLKNDDELYIDKFLQFVSINHFFSKKIARARSLKNFLKSLFLGVPLSIQRNFSKTFKHEIADKISEFDVLFVDHYLMFQYVPANYKGRVILHEHNAEYKIWKSFATKERDHLKRLIFQFEAKRVLTYEREICNRSSVILASPNDIENLVAIGIERKRFEQTLHLGDIELLQMDDLLFDEKKREILFIGTLSWEPNKDGLRWFIEAILPAIRAVDSSVKLTIIGRGCDRSLREYLQNRDGCSFLGEVDDLGPYYKMASLFVSPLKFGSGIKVKNINAMYRGIPLVTTSVGVEGIDVKNGHEVMIADDADQFVDVILKLIRDEKMWSSLSQKSRDFARRELNWDPVLATVKRVVEWSS